MDTIYTVKQVCELLQLHPNTVWLALKNGKLKGYKVGKDWRIYDKDLKKYFESGAK